MYSEKIFKISAKKCLQLGKECVIIPRYAVKVWRKTCDDVGGGPSRTGKFPRSMSDFKPGEDTWSARETCDPGTTAKRLAVRN